MENIKEFWDSNQGKRSFLKHWLKNEDDDVCFDSDFVANKFNRYFCNIAKKLVDKPPLRTYREDRVQDYYKEKGIERNSFKFNVVEQLEVENMLRKPSTGVNLTGCIKSP